MPNGGPLILGEFNQAIGDTHLDVPSGRFVITNFVEGGLGLIALGRGTAVFGIGENAVVGEAWNPGDPNQYAGVFTGNVVVYGNYTVFDGSKSAAVRHTDGSHRLLYSMESPESWFEDFGASRLVRGRTRVKLDRDFAAVIRTGHYHVFLTPEGDSNGLYVGKRNKTGFEVREQANGKSSVRFSYRIVAKRKDIAGPRFPKVRPPKLAKVARPREPARLRAIRRKQAVE